MYLLMSDRLSALQLYERVRLGHCGVFFFQPEDGIRDPVVTGVQTCALPIWRAHSVAHSDPRGPVYLMLPRETLAQTWDAAAVRSFPEARYGPAGAGAAPADSIA